MILLTINYAIKKEVCILKSMEEKMPVVFVWLPVQLEYNIFTKKYLLQLLIYIVR